MTHLKNSSHLRKKKREKEKKKKLNPHVLASLSLSFCLSRIKGVIKPSIISSQLHAVSQSILFITTYFHKSHNTLWSIKYGARSHSTWCCTRREQKDGHCLKENLNIRQESGWLERDVHWVPNSSLAFVLGWVILAWFLWKGWGICVIIKMDLRAEHRISFAEKKVERCSSANLTCVWQMPA